MKINNYAGISRMMSNTVKSFDVLTISLNVLDNYDGPTKLFSDLYLAKFLEIKINYNNKQI